MKIGARAIAPSFGMTLMQKASTTDTVFRDTLNELTAMGFVRKKPRGPIARYSQTGQSHKG
jgi:ribosomal protein S19E (S16A)